MTLYKQRLNGDWAPWEETQGGGEWKKVDGSVAVGHSPVPASS